MARLNFAMRVLGFSARRGGNQDNKEEAVESISSLSPRKIKRSDKESRIEYSRRSNQLS
jgi:hypothetical protein